MLKINLVELNDNAIVPEGFAREGDAGFDFFTPLDFTLNGGKSKLIDTGVGVEFLNKESGKKYMLKIESKSGLSSKYNIRVCAGVVDEGYRGSIGVMLHNYGENKVEFKRGEKIAQGIVFELPQVEICYSNKFVTEDTDRGDGGFGSTGD